MAEDKGGQFQQPLGKPAFHRGPNGFNYALRRPDETYGQDSRYLTQAFKLNANHLDSMGKGWTEFGLTGNLCDLMNSEEKFCVGRGVFLEKSEGTIGPDEIKRATMYELVSRFFKRGVGSHKLARKNSGNYLSSAEQIEVHFKDLETNPYGRNLKHRMSLADEHDLKSVKTALTKAPDKEFYDTLYAYASGFNSAEEAAAAKILEHLTILYEQDLVLQAREDERKDRQKHLKEAFS